MAELIRDKGTLRNVESLVARLRLETVLLLRQVVSTARFSSIDQLLDMIRSVGTRLVAAQPKEIAVGNMVRRVIHQVREEYLANTGGADPSLQRPAAMTRANTMSTPDGSALSLANFVLLGRPKVTTRPTREVEASIGEVDRRSMATKPALIDAVKEIVDEMEGVFEVLQRTPRTIFMQSESLVACYPTNTNLRSSEIVLTIGYSRTVEEFLKAAAHDKKFTIHGQQLADSLSRHGISTFLVPDSAIFAMIRAGQPVGALAAAVAARAHATSAGAADYGDPGLVMGYDEGELVGSVEVINPKYDYVKPEFLDVIVTNYGDHPPSYVYKLVKEMYEDENLE
ncbi:nagb rpia CoA transferase-like protein [Rhizoctonia solani]|uniref:Translation initiation factor eIF2B subunit beta n=1 Tax=Rhizoctonia solani TaxID=456999 RepID=A0A8H7IH29_9AGAM|nr:nagb rpia CoA transferase-like protein [Rhizoctonia solani]